MVVAAYLPALGCGFIWDDDDYITENATLRDPDGLRRIWLEPRATPQYYPLVHTTFWIEYHLWGLQSAGYHLVNVILHAANTVLVWLILRKLSIPGAWMAAAVFGLHPVHVESVAWVTERKNVLSGLFYLSSLLVYADIAGIGTPPVATRPRRWLTRYLVATALFAAALLSKSVTCSLPAAILLLIAWKRRLAWQDIRLLVPWFMLGSAVACITVVLEKTHVGAAGSPFAWGFLERCLIAGRALCFYVGKLAWPYPLTFMYPRWQLDAGDPWQWAPVAACLATLVFFFAMRRRWGLGPLVAVLFFAGTLFPALGFFDVYPMRYSFVADHFQYLASLGPITLAAAAWAGRSSGAMSRLLPMNRPLAALLLGTLAALTWHQVRIYRNAESLWTDVLDRNPQSCAAHFHLGKVRTSQGKVREATRHFRAALALQADTTEQPIIQTLLANSLVREGQIEQAREAFAQALRQEPNSWEALTGLGNLLARQGQPEQAIPLYRRALAVAPRQAAIHHNLANALAVVGDLDESETCYREAIRLDPSSAAAHFNLGNLLARQQRYGEAIEAFVAALRIEPNFKPALRNLSQVRAAQRAP
jgi:tetratricopeptide (TPR) repeat protein